MCYLVRMIVYEIVIIVLVLNFRELKFIYRVVEIVVVFFLVLFKLKKLINGEKFLFVEKYFFVLDLEFIFSKII